MRVSGREQSKARAAARRLAVQALYQWQLGRLPAAELIAQFAATPEHARVDPDYFRAAVKAVCEDDGGIDAELARHSDIEPGRLDPVEHAILALGVWELMSRPEVPRRAPVAAAQRSGELWPWSLLRSPGCRHERKSRCRRGGGETRASPAA